MSIGLSASLEKKPVRRDPASKRAGRPLDAAKRAAIIDAAAHHFFHHGYAASAIEQIAEMPFWIRPLITVGDGTTAINVRVFGRRGRI